MGHLVTPSPCWNVFFFRQSRASHLNCWLLLLPVFKREKYSQLFIHMPLEKREEKMIADATVTSNGNKIGKYGLGDSRRPGHTLATSLTFHPTWWAFFPLYIFFLFPLRSFFRCVLCNNNSWNENKCVWRQVTSSFEENLLRIQEKYIPGAVCYIGKKKKKKDG